MKKWAMRRKEHVARMTEIRKFIKILVAMLDCEKSL
jgi:hypothetical protein